MTFRALLCIALAGCGGMDMETVDASDQDAGPIDDGGGPGTDANVTPCTTPAECEQHAIDRFNAIVTNQGALTTFLHDMPKGGDLHNHLTGAVYAETYLDWANRDGDCINSSTHTIVAPGSCSMTNVAVPVEGMLYEDTIRAWSMQDFVADTESGHEHFFATFSKYGLVAGAHRNEDLADVATRAADENQVYLETMFNLGTNVGSLATDVWMDTVSAEQLPAFYAQLMANMQFTTELAHDVNAVNNAYTGYRNALGCSSASPPAACDVSVRFIAQVSRIGANQQIFGQLVSAFEMGAMTPYLVGLNLSSPEDNTNAISNYALHMAMLDFLNTQYATTSPLHVTLHAGELVPAYLPSGSTANTFHVRAAVETGHAERIGHGVDVLSETDPEGLLTEMHDAGVLVEVCLSSNDQILEVSGANHPLSQYLSHGVPVALATDDQGVSRSSMAGEYRRAVNDQHLDYLQLKALSRNSLEHAFLPGASLWSSITDGQPVADCAPLAAPPASCQAFLDANERARTQWELEQRFLRFESAQ